MRTEQSSSHCANLIVTLPQETFPLGESSKSPLHFAAHRDESVIVGYYTSGEVHLRPRHLPLNPERRDAEHLCILHGSMMILLFIRSRVFSVPIVTGLCGAKRIIFHVIGKFFVERSELHEFLSLIPIFCLAVPIAFCYSGVRKSRTQFTQKGGKTLCSKRNPVPVR